MSPIRSRTFLCCLPVRFGVFVMTILGMVGGTTLAVVGWMQTIKLQGLQPKSNEIALYIQSALYTLLGVLSVFGFIGAIVKNRTMVNIFFMVLVGHLVFSIFTGAFALYNIFHASNEDAIQSCVNSSNADGSNPADCQQAYDVFKGIAVGIFILVWLIEIWGCVIAHDYVGQLDDEADAKANGRWPKANDLEAARS